MYIYIYPSSGYTGKYSQQYDMRVSIKIGDDPSFFIASMYFKHGRHDVNDSWGNCLKWWPTFLGAIDLSSMVHMLYI